MWLFNIRILGYAKSSYSNFLCILVPYSINPISSLVWITGFLDAFSLVIRIELSSASCALITSLVLGILIFLLIPISYALVKL